METYKVYTASVFGNFKWSAKAEVTEAQGKVLMQYGLLQLLQRTPSTNAEKAMAGYDKRPKGFKRGSLRFSEERAEMLKRALRMIEGDDEMGDIECEVVVAEYVPDQKEVKYAQARKIWESKGGDVEKLEALAEKVGWPGEVEGDENGEPAVGFLFEITEFIKGL